MIIHPIPPVYDAQSKILILGSFPSVKSREAMFFYGHPQNRFWKVLAALFNEPLPTDIPRKKELLLRNHIAVWDVIHSCDIVGSSDASIRNVTVNDLQLILNSSPINGIYTNGSTAGRLYAKHAEPVTGRPATVLPSTSPANAAWKLDRLIEKWGIILEENVHYRS